MPQISHDPWPESAIAVLRNPCSFIADRCRRLQLDLYQEAKSDHTTLAQSFVTLSVTKGLSERFFAALRMT
jgi:hypothetical protein